MAKRAHPRPVTIAVPASIANLGPGLDTLALAVTLYLRVRVRRARGVNRLRFDFGKLKLAGENLIETGFRRLAGAREFPSLDIAVETDIPLRSGLGSSSAALVAGFRIFEWLFGPQPEETLLAAGCELEGHPENVAAALLGGLVACCQRPDGSVIALTAAWPRELRIVVATPETQLETRQVAPGTAAVGAARERGKQRAARGGICWKRCAARRYDVLGGGVPRLFAPAQPLRHRAGPRSAAGARHRDVLGVFLSGSGPSLAAVATQFARGGGAGRRYALFAMRRRELPDEDSAECILAGTRFGELW
jgi:homoserine kinase